jgi:hypothetical protein
VALKDNVSLLRISPISLDTIGRGRRARSCYVVMPNNLHAAFAKAPGQAEEEPALPMRPANCPAPQRAGLSLQTAPIKRHPSAIRLSERCTQGNVLRMSTSFVSTHSTIFSILVYTMCLYACAHLPSRASLPLNASNFTSVY